jgi:ABC-2 type transport system permease protein
VFSTLGLILFLVFAIGAGARAIAGEEEGRTLDLLLSTPIRRRQVLLGKWVAMAVSALGIVAALGLAIAVVGPAFGVHVGLADLALGRARCCYLLGLAFGTRSRWPSGAQPGTAGWRTASPARSRPSRTS